MPELELYEKRVAEMYDNSFPIGAIRKPLPPCDDDCLNCRCPVEKCRGSRRGLASPYAAGTLLRSPEQTYITSYPTEGL